MTVFISEYDNYLSLTYMFCPISSVSLSTMVFKADIVIIYNLVSTPFPASPHDGNSAPGLLLLKTDYRGTDGLGRWRFHHGDSGRDRLVFFVPLRATQRWASGEYLGGFSDFVALF